MVQAIANPPISSSEFSIRAASPITSIQEITNFPEYTSASLIRVASPITSVQAIANQSENTSASSSRAASPISSVQSIAYPSENASASAIRVASPITSVQAIANQSENTSASSSRAASPIPRPLEQLRQKTTFSVKLNTDRRTPGILDVQLLSSGRLVLADNKNKCMKLFTTQGQHLYTLKCRSYPRRLAVLNNEGACHAVAVTLHDCNSIDIVEVADGTMKVKKTLATSIRYDAVAAVSKQTLAVGHWDVSGIDLIDLDGRILRHICSSVDPCYMDVTKDGDLMCSTWDDTIARVQLNTTAETVVFDKPGTGANCSNFNGCFCWETGTGANCPNFNGCFCLETGTGANCPNFNGCFCWETGTGAYCSNFNGCFCLETGTGANCSNFDGCFLSTIRIKLFKF
ncbi:hypothetical protein PoB_004320400 [Plakobranchus ocellatus]|uniref:EGF-like domain-containing protein n=1 Tax=Plakobranchus ocellatus TaxID=259542 RepID=A0AAV4B9A3_9GAST|nr:hypothetical protein PoB_004320400 [Plakobranchus ocellatus]